LLIFHRQSNTKSLAHYDLTKAEKLQVVNLAPTLPVELYVIVEELEDRIGDKMDEVLALVQSSLSSSAPVPSGEVEIRELIVSEEELHQPIDHSEWTTFDYDDDVDAIGEEEHLDDAGEGAGVDGDLEMEED